MAAQMWIGGTHTQRSRYMDYRWIESPPNTNVELKNMYLFANRIKRSAHWPKEHAHGDEKLTIYFTWPKGLSTDFVGEAQTDCESGEY